MAPSGFSEEMEGFGQVACGGFAKGRLQIDCILPLLALKEVSPERTADGGVYHPLRIPGRSGNQEVADSLKIRRAQRFPRLPLMP